jgi:hypothetical protein
VSTWYEINGYPIGGKAVDPGTYLLQGTEYAPALAPRRAVLEVPNTHYALPLWNDPLSQITVSLAIRVKGVDADDLQSRWMDLMALLGMGTNQPVTLTRHTGSFSYTADAQLVSMATPDFSCPRSRVDATIVFNIPGGAWRGPQVTTQYFNGTHTLPAALASNLPIADPLLMVAGPVTTFQLTDNTSNTSIFWGDGNTTVASGKYLIIDPKYMRARVVDAMTNWNFSSGTNVTGALEFRGNGPLTFTARTSGEFAARQGTFTINHVGSNNGVWVRVREAVV